MTTITEVILDSTLPLDTEIAGIDSDPTVGTGSNLSRVPSHGIVDDGYADTDDTSRWIERMETLYA